MGMALDVRAAWFQTLGLAKKGNALSTRPQDFTHLCYRLTPDLRHAAVLHQSRLLVTQRLCFDQAEASLVFSTAVVVVFEAM